jgi:ATP-binding cassette subfamily B (MDR/TAP) protein 1
MTTFGESSSSTSVSGEVTKQTNNAENDEIADPHEPRIILGSVQLWRYIAWEVPWILIAMIGAAGDGAILHIFYLVFADVLGELSSGLSQKAANAVALKMVWVSIGAGVSLMLKSFGSSLAHDRIEVRLKTSYFNSITKQEIGYFDRKKVGGLISEISEHLEAIATAYTEKLAMLVRHTTSVILGLVLSFVYGWKLALVMLSAIPVIALAAGVTAFVFDFFTKRATIYSNRAASMMNEVIGAIRTVRSMDGEERARNNYSNYLRGAQPMYFAKAIVFGLAMFGTSFSIWALCALGTWYGSKLVNRGEMNLVNFFRVFGFVIIAMESISQASDVMQGISKATAPVEAILKIIKRVPEFNTQGGNGEVVPNKIDGYIEFKDVSFSYPTRPDVVVLKNFNLKINPGMTVALVGPSGSGKSTIVGLMEKFYLPQSGSLFLDGVDLSTIDSRWLHRNIGIVTQEPTLFATSIRKNIEYAIDGLREVTEEEIIQAAKNANAHDFIMALPNQYDTVIGERGTSLSGGQKQRIAIARAMIQNPSLLLLDEATSALDTKSESLVQEALNVLMHGRTSIIVAHRLTTIIHSDVICVLDRGIMKEQGSHEELMQKENGLYRSMALLQMINPVSTTSTQSDTDTQL